MRDRRGRHRARRPRLETLARAAVALTLCAPLATIAPTPATAGTTLAVDLLGDLAPDPNIPDSYLLEGPVASGDRTFFSAAAAESAAIFSTSGAPGDAVEMTFPPTPACTDAPAPYDLVAVGDGSVVFQSQAGCNNGQQRLVITDGSNDPGTTCPVQPQGTCDFAEYTGYYGISPRVYYQGQYAGEGPSTLSPTTSEGVVFAAAAVDTNSDSNPVYGDYLPYQLDRKSTRLNSSH